MGQPWYDCRLLIQSGLSCAPDFPSQPPGQWETSFQTLATMGLEMDLAVANHNFDPRMVQDFVAEGFQLVGVCYGCAEAIGCTMEAVAVSSQRPLPRPCCHNS